MSNITWPCLLCDGVASQFQRSILKQRHETKHPTVSAEFPEGEELRTKKAQTEQND